MRNFTIHHVLPDVWGSYVDIFASLQLLSDRRSGTFVTPSRSFDRKSLWHSMDSKQVYIVWDLETAQEIDWNQPRQCKIGIVYSEALDKDPTKLLPEHQTIWRAFCEVAQRADFVLAHTPWMVQTLRAFVSTPVFLMPVGYSPEAMGSPRWHAPKFDLLAFWGTMAGKRQDLIPIMLQKLSPVLKSISGSFGRGLLGQLDTTAAALLIGHSDIGSYSTWRLWQVASTSAAIISEPGDTWPFEAHRHFLEIPVVTHANVDEICQKLMTKALTKPDRFAFEDNLLRMAKIAHDEVAKVYTFPTIEDHFVKPALAKLFYA